MEKDKVAFLTILVAFIGFLVAGTTWYVVPHLPLVWRISLGIAVLSFGAYLFMEREHYARSLSKKTTQYGINSVAMAILAVAVAVVVNLIASNYDVKKDLTKNKLHTLSDQSVKIVKGLANPVVIKGFVAPNQMQEWDAVFNKYTYVSPKIKREFVDADKDPTVVQRYSIKQLGTIIVESGERNTRVENLFGPEDPKVEEKLTNAIIGVSKGEKKKVYWVSGHGERLISDTGREGYSEMKETMENSRFKIEELVLVDKDKIPADAEVVVVAGPKSDFMEHELKLVEGYLKSGGKVFFMVEPLSTASVRPLLSKFGAEWKPKKTVLETNRLQQLAGGNPLTPIVRSYSKSHEITQEAQQVSIFPIASPVEKGTKIPSDYKVESLFSTSPQSLEVEFTGTNVKIDEKSDRKGPLSLGVAISGKSASEKKEPPKSEKKPEAKAEEKEEKKDPEFRLVVVGDADFGSNGVKKFGINADLFQNMMSWLAKEEDLISIRPKPTDTSEFEITEARFRVIYLASVWFMPMIMLFSGLGMWFYRRRK